VCDSTWVPIETMHGAGVNFVFFSIFLNYFNMSVLKIIKNYYFNIFLNRKTIEK